MKRLIDITVAMVLGIVATTAFFNQQVKFDNNQVYGSRNIKSEVNAEIERVNLILDDSEKKYIKTNIPKPKPPNPIECNCNGTKEIVHGDGHKTPCSCGANCKCAPKATPQ